VCVGCGGGVAVCKKTIEQKLSVMGASFSELTQGKEGQRAKTEYSTEQYTVESNEMCDRTTGKYDF
jgi:hypothetical protein